VYKKTDSLLRGNIGAELEAAALGRGGPVLFIPAWPRLGRITAGGRQFLNGVHIDRGAADALNPVRNSFIPVIIAESSPIPVSLLTGPPGERREEIRRIPRPGKKIIVMDAETGEDLAAAAELLRKADLLATTAGCAGFAEALVKVLFPGRSRSGIMRFPVRPLLLVSGSRHPASIAQVRKALADKVPGLPADPDASSGLSGGIAAKCAEFLAGEGVCILGTPESMGLVPGYSVPGSARSGAAKAAESLGALVRDIFDRAGPAHLAVFGGDTLFGLTQALGYGCLVPVDEMGNGVAVSAAYGGGDPLLIISKAGSFGEPGLIRDIREKTGIYERVEGDFRPRRDGRT
jgi:uncharacterized protein YgbK (DUF1537 family)